MSCLMRTASPLRWPRQRIAPAAPVVSMTTSENISPVSMRTEDTCAMWIECSCLPIHCGV